MKFYIKKMHTFPSINVLVDFKLTGPLGAPRPLGGGCLMYFYVVSDDQSTIFFVISMYIYIYIYNVVSSFS